MAFTMADFTDDIIQEMSKDELINLLSHYRDLEMDANHLIYYRGEVIDALQHLNSNLNFEHLADRHYRDKRSVIDQVASELVAKYYKPPIKENADKSYVGKRRETGCIDDFLVDEKVAELINKACKPIPDSVLKISIDPVETTLTEAIPKSYKL